MWKTDPARQTTDITIARLEHLAQISLKWSDKGRNSSPNGCSKLAYPSLYVSSAQYFARTFDLSSIYRTVLIRMYIRATAFQLTFRVMSVLQWDDSGLA